jgi:hypothetical protein
MTSEQREALQEAFDRIRQLMSDVEEDAREKGFAMGYDVATSEGGDSSGAN